MTQIKGNNRDSGKVIKMSLQDEKSEKGKQIFETKDTEWITNPTEAAEMDDGLYIVTPKKGPKRIELTESEKEIQKTLEKSITKETIDEWGWDEMMRQVRKEYLGNPNTKGLEDKK